MRRKRIDYRPDDDGDFAQIVELAADYQRARDDGRLYDAALIALRLDATAGRLTDDALLAFVARTARARRELSRESGISRGALDHRIKRARSRRDGKQEEP